MNTRLFLKKDGMGILLGPSRLFIIGRCLWRDLLYSAKQLKTVSSFLELQGK